MKTAWAGVRGTVVVDFVNSVDQEHDARSVKVQCVLARIVSDGAGDVLEKSVMLMEIGSEASAWMIGIGVQNGSSGDLAQPAQLVDH